MTRVAIEDAGAQLARLVREAVPGQEIILTQDEQDVAKLIPLNTWHATRTPEGRYGARPDPVHGG